MQIKLLKDAGAIVMAKTNMAEWAFAPDVSIGSTFGVVRNPYDLDRSTAGSSGGTAAGDCLGLILFNDQYFLKIIHYFWELLTVCEPQYGYIIQPHRAS